MEDWLAWLGSPLDWLLSNTVIVGGGWWTFLKLLGSCVSVELSHLSEASATVRCQHGQLVGYSVSQAARKCAISYQQSSCQQHGTSLQYLTFNTNNVFKLLTWQVNLPFINYIWIFRKQYLDKYFCVFCQKIIEKLLQKKINHISKWHLVWQDHLFLKLIFWAILLSDWPTLRQSTRLCPLIGWEIWQENLYLACW